MAPQARERLTLPRTLEAVRRVVPHRGPLFLLGAAVAYWLSFDLPTCPLRPGLDPSIWLAANIHSRHGLEMGRDLAHVFGPLGRLVYPVAGHGHLRQAHLLAAALSLVFVASLVAHSLSARRWAGPAVLLATSAFFLFRDPRLTEGMVYTVVLTLWILDLVQPRVGYGLVAAAVSAVFAFAKFNMALTLVPVTALALALARHRGAGLGGLAARAGAFLVPAVAVAHASFSSVESLALWVGRSMDIAGGNSEAMSSTCPDGELALALLIVALTAALALVGGPRDPLSGLVWLVLVAVPLYTEFKHGFVRADRHVYFFFSFMPCLAATRLLAGASPLALSLVLVSGALNAAGPGIRFEPFTVREWASRAHAHGLRLLWQGSHLERAQVQEDAENLRTSALLPWELETLGGATVDFMPSDHTPLYGTSLHWRPRPFFQDILVRSLRADSTNAHHLASAQAASWVVWEWRCDDGVHPFHRCPLTYRTLLEQYRFVRGPAASPRLLLGRGRALSVTLSPLDSTVVRWGRGISIPPSPHMVTASVRVGRTLPGRLLKVAFRTPPVYLVFEDGSRWRFIPATAPHGLVVSGMPLCLAHVAYLWREGRPHPESATHTRMKFVAPHTVKHFSDEISVVFWAVHVERVG